MSRVYYNENDPFAAQWLRNLMTEGLLPVGTVDTRSIADVQAQDLEGYTQCHFFAGIGGWPFALSIAGWGERPVWTGSCPCQPFSCTGKKLGEKDARHLWPELRRLITQCSPPTVFGEQVAGSSGLQWLSGVRIDLEALGYGVGCADLCAAGTQAPHLRQRLFWVADSGEPTGQWDTGSVPRAQAKSSDGRELDGDCAERPSDGCKNSSLANGDRDRFSGVAQPDMSALRPRQQAPRRTDAPRCGESVRMAHRESLDESRGAKPGDGISFAGSGQTDNDSPSGRCRESGPWSDCRVIDFADGSKRRLGTGVMPLAHGLPRSMGRGEPELSGLVKRARANRVGRIRGYGNAIVPQLAAVFIRAFMEVEDAACPTPQTLPD